MFFIIVSTYAKPHNTPFVQNVLMTGVVTEFLYLLILNVPVPMAKDNPMTMRMSWFLIFGASCLSLVYGFIRSWQHRRIVHLHLQICENLGLLDDNAMKLVLSQELKTEVASAFLVAEYGEDLSGMKGIVNWRYIEDAY